MYPGVDPKQLAQVQQIGRHIKGVITVDYAKNTVLLELSTTNPEAAKALPEMVKSFSRSLGQMLSTFFAVQGKLIESNAPKGEQQKK
jgi:hypothetical protein